MSTMTDLARKVLLGQDAGALSTHSVDCPGYPFGSIVPIGFDENNRPILLISRLAQHTQNISKNPRVALLLSDVAERKNLDVQTCARVTLMGEAKKLEAGSDSSAIARYCRFYPQAEAYSRELDFDFYRLEPVKVRFIAGFGQIHWVEPDVLFTANPLAGQAEIDICDHMNADHVDALQRYCQQYGVQLTEDAGPVMIGVDAFGFHQRVGERIFRFEFPEPVSSPNEVRKALIAMLKCADD
jgi:hypothetical protein